MGPEMERGVSGGSRRQPSPWRPQLTAQEQRVGWVFFALYLFVFPFLMGGVLRLLDEHLELWFTAAQSNAVYYLAVLLLLTAVFWDFLKNALRILREHLRRNVFALLLAVAAGLSVTCLVSLILLPVANPVIGDYKEQFALSPGYTVAVVMFLRPLVEELLFRGLLFGSLRKKNRVVAYAVSIGVSALGAVWQFMLPGGGPVYLLLAIRYVPLAAAATWAYDVGGSVFTPMAARVILSGLFFVFALMA